MDLPDKYIIVLKFGNERNACFLVQLLEQSVGAVVLTKEVTFAGLAVLAQFFFAVGVWFF